MPRNLLSVLFAFWTVLDLTGLALAQDNTSSIRNRLAELCGDSSGLKWGSPWPMPGGCPARVGLSASFGPETSESRWSVSLSGAVHSSPVVNSDGSIVIGSDAGRIFSVHPADGRVIWSKSLGNMVRSSPALGRDGTIYVGAHTNRIHALRGSDGHELWSFDTYFDVLASPVVGADGTVYVGSESGIFYALTPQGGVKWRFLTGAPIVSSAAIGPDGTIFFGSSNTHVYALRPDGSQKWARTVWSQVRSSPAVADGVLYIGSNASRLHALDVNDGQILWEKDFGAAVIGSPAISADGTIYVGADDRKLHALNPDGSERWAFLTGGTIRSTPVIDREGRVFVGSSDQSFYAIRPNGTLLWKRATGLAIVSSAALGYHRVIYFGSTDGFLYAWGEKDVDNDPCLSWTDSDVDRTVDCVDLCVNDPSLTSPTAGCGCSCSGRGVCVADGAGGHCVCGADSSGADCSSDTTTEAGATSIQEVIPTDTAGRAVLNYLYLLYGSDSPSLVAQAKTALRAVPAVQLVAVLRSSWAQARSATERGALLHALGVSDAPEALELYDEILSASVASELLDFDPHQKDLAREVAVLVRATAGVSRLAQLRVTGADSLLLDTVRHPLPPVRRFAAYSVLKLGDSVLREELRARLLSGDEGFMQLRRATTNDINLLRPPDPTPENDASHGERASEKVFL